MANQTAEATENQEKDSDAKKVTNVSYASKTMKRDRRSRSEQLDPIVDEIHTAENIKEKLFSLTDKVKSAFKCEEATIYALDRINRQIYSCNFKSDKIDEIRVPINTASLAGFVASTGKSINIADVNNSEELTKINPRLKFDSSWDKKTGFKTKSAVIVPLPYNKKLMGVLELLNKTGAKMFSDEDVRLARELANTLGFAILKIEVEEIQEKLITTSHAIHSAQSMDDILLKMKTPILQIFDSELLTIYAVDTSKNEIYSKAKTGDKVKEIRVPISSKSISGWVAQDKKIVNIKDVYNQEELNQYNPELTFDSFWDKKTGIRTKSMLVQPIMHETKLMGVLQVVNKRHDKSFSEFDQKNAKIICASLALAFLNHQKLSQAKTSKFGFLVMRGVITNDELTQATSKARKEEQDIETVFLKEFNLRREDIGKSLEHYYKIQYFGYNGSFVIPQKNFSGINKDFLLKNHWVPLYRDEGMVTILVDDPEDTEKLEQIKTNFSKDKIDYKVALKADIEDFINTAVDVEEEEKSSPKAEDMSEIIDSMGGGSLYSASEIEEEEDDSANMFSDKNSGIVRLVNKVITEAYSQGVSDIHIEPGVERKNMKIRFRRDGACHVYEEIPYIFKQAVISRIKIMSRLNIAEKRLPQDGKIKMKYGKNEIELRVATCPTVGGNEDIVMRILAASKPLPLDAMNFSARNLDLVKKSIVKPYGLALVVGPTGSGKTTTLHSILGHINTPQKKIWTAEDPVEITQDGLRQVQMQSGIGLDFARAMRSFLRGDPDIIMVGEMRDQETCAIGVEASLTGHLVFSTLHTNSAPETITRLIDMGMNPINFADALLLIVAQRLVRTLCKFCKQPYSPTENEFKDLVQEYGEERFKKLDIHFSEFLTFYRPNGCARCNQTGYSGRTGLHEVLEGTDEMKRLIMKQAVMAELRQQAFVDGMTTLKQDGIAKIFKGDCDLKQVLAVCM